LRSWIVVIRGTRLTSGDVDARLWIRSHPAVIRGTWTCSPSTHCRRLRAWTGTMRFSTSFHGSPTASRLTSATRSTRSASRGISSRA
jgi:hypothetical protein